MDVKKLEYLLRVSETGSITEAAKQLYITQPALSQSISMIEKKYDIKLFERREGGLFLTDAGKIFVDAARNQALIEANLMRELEDARMGNSGTLRVGMSVNRTTQFLPVLLPEFKAQFSRVSLIVDTHSYLGFEKMVVEGKLDMALVMNAADTTPEIRRKLKYEPLFEYHTLLAVPPRHPLAERTGGIFDWRLRPPVSLDLVRSEPFIVAPRKARTDRWLFSIYNAYDFTPNVIVTVNGSCQYDLVQSGVGCALLQDSVGFGRKKGVFFRLDKGDFAVQLCMIYRKDTHRNRAMEAFVELIKKKNREGVWRQIPREFEIE